MTDSSLYIFMHEIYLEVAFDDKLRLLIVIRMEIPAAAVFLLWSNLNC